jgi:hypothetical protein
VIESEEFLDHLFECLFATNSFLDEVPTQVCPNTSNSFYVENSSTPFFSF